jgi:hypothetical protein
VRRIEQLESAFGRMRLEEGTLFGFSEDFFRFELA